jgi:uncharacterized repeat protein (TIGR03803 family)
MRFNQISRKLQLISLLPVLFFVSWAAAQTASPAGGVQHTILHNFGGPDGAAPEFTVVPATAGSFFGATILGGKYSWGTVFKLTPSGKGYKQTVLHNFTGGADGLGPWGVVVDQNGAVYGGTLGGGSSNCPFGCGTIYKLTPGKSGYTFSVIHTLLGTPDAGQVVGPLLLDKNGALYGAGQTGGTSNWGAAFKLVPGKSGYTESVIYSFPGGTGVSGTGAGLAMDKHGALYGTGGGGTGNCGGQGCGVVFKLTRTKSGYSENTIYNFKDYTDGNDPVAAVTIDETTGAIYGTTQYGGSKDNGTVFRLTPSGSGYTETILYDFSTYPGLSAPEANVLLGPNGVLYGTASLRGGGCNGIGCGGVFQLTPSGSGYTYKLVYRFALPINGADPEHSGLISDASGALYGATRSGGSKTDCYDGGPGGALGCGTVFKLVLK